MTLVKTVPLLAVPVSMIGERSIPNSSANKAPDSSASPLRTNVAAG